MNPRPRPREAAPLLARGRCALIYRVMPKQERSIMNYAESPARCGPRRAARGPGRAASGARPRGNWAEQPKSHNFSQTNLHRFRVNSSFISSLCALGNAVCGFNKRNDSEDGRSRDDPEFSLSGAGRRFSGHRGTGGGTFGAQGVAT